VDSTGQVGEPPAGADTEASARETATDGPVIVTVHGTNDHHADDEGDRWWQRGSAFCERLTAELAGRGMPGAQILPLRWSGMNSDYDRLAASVKLTRLLRQLDKSGRRHAVIAHSHGGNVVAEALARTPRARQRGSIVTFGTPFFSRRLKAVPRLIAMFQMVMGVVIAPIMVWYLVTTLMSDTSKKIESVVLFGGLCAMALWNLMRGARKLFYRRLATRAFARGLDPLQWLVVYSPRDEAMRLLESAALISPQYVTVPSAMRSLTAFAKLASVASTGLVFTLTGRYFLEPIVTKVRAGQFGLATAADLTFLLLVPLVYGAIFGLIWLVARLGGAWLWARTLTAAIHGGVIGAAYGGDGPYVLTGVTRTPPYGVSPREARLEAANLGGIDDEAIFVAAHKLYSAVVAHDTPEGGFADPDAMWKHLSDALYHNAYMRDEVVIAGVADHLTEGWDMRLG
jgi:hypothetical protein